jgi:hypothetical protein
MLSQMSSVAGVAERVEPAGYRFQAGDFAGSGGIERQTASAALQASEVI